MALHHPGDLAHTVRSGLGAAPFCARGPPWHGAPARGVGNMGRLDVRAILADPLTRSKNSRAIARENREFARDSRQLDPPRGPVVALKWFTHRPNGELRAVTQEGHTCQVVPVGTWRTVKGKQVESVAYLARIYLKGETGMVQVHRRDAHGAKTPYFLWVGKAKLACMHWLLRRADGRGSDECP